MRVIDERGRLFGKVNLIDAAVAILVLLLIPLAYGAFVLFRTPAPKITSLVPAQIVEQHAASIEVNGEDLRPFLLAKLGTVAVDFFVQSPTRAEIKVPANLPAGTYDLTLADQGQLLTVKPGALTVAAAPAPPVVRLDVQAVGAFVGLANDDAESIGLGSKFQPSATAEPIAEVLALEAPEPGTSRVKIGLNTFATGTLADLRLPATIRLHCTVSNEECKVADTVAAPNTTITLPWMTPASGAGGARPGTGQVKFAIDQLSPIAAAVPAAGRLDVQAVGAFVGLDEDEARFIRLGSKFQRSATARPIAEVLAVKAPEPGTSRVKLNENVFATGTLSEMRLPAIIRLRCTVVNEECVVGGAVAGQNATIVLPWAPPAASDGAARPRVGHARFLIDQLFPPGIDAAFPAVALVRVRFVGVPTILDAIKVGDVDLSGSVIDTDRAVLTEVGGDRQAVSASMRTEAASRVSLNVQQPALAFTGRLRIPLVFTPSGWSYKDRPVRVGGSFVFETVGGTMSGWVLEMNLAPEKSRRTR